MPGGLGVASSNLAAPTKKPSENKGFPPASDTPFLANKGTKRHQKSRSGTKSPGKTPERVHATFTPVTGPPPENESPAATGIATGLNGGIGNNTPVPYRRETAAASLSHDEAAAFRRAPALWSDVPADLAPGGEPSLAVVKLRALGLIELALPAGNFLGNWRWRATAAGLARRRREDGL
jgi:hypothetical protein